MTELSSQPLPGICWHLASRGPGGAVINGGQTMLLNRFLLQHEPRCPYTDAAHLRCKPQGEKRTKLQINPPFACLKPAGRCFHVRSSLGFKPSKKVPKNPLSGDTARRHQGNATTGMSLPSYGCASLSPCPAPALRLAGKSPSAEEKPVFICLLVKAGGWEEAHPSHTGWGTWRQLSKTNPRKPGILGHYLRLVCLTPLFLQFQKEQCHLAVPKPKRSSPGGFWGDPVAGGMQVERDL